MTRILAIVACLGAAACAANGAKEAPQPLPAGLSQTGQAGDDGDCMDELYAYASVASLAKKLGSDSDVFSDALGDLREQLVDCLTSPPPELTPIGARRRRPAAKGAQMSSLALTSPRAGGSEPRP